MFGGALFVGLAIKKPLLKIMFDGALHVTEEGWRRLTWRWAFFFLALAALNELVWRTQSTDVWVKFKTFGFLPLTLAVRPRPSAADHALRGQERTAGRGFLAPVPAWRARPGERFAFAARGDPRARRRVDRRLVIASALAPSVPRRGRHAGNSVPSRRIR